MRCSSSEAPRGAVRGRPARAGVALALLAGALLAAGCRTTETRVVYVPSTERPRYTLEEGGAMLARFLRYECPRPTPAGETDSLLAQVLVSDEGDVEEAEIRGSTGNTTTDGIIGAIAAQLTFRDASPRPAPGTTTVVARYRCGEDYSAAFALGGA